MKNTKYHKFIAAVAVFALSATFLLLDDEPIYFADETEDRRSLLTAEKDEPTDDPDRTPTDLGAQTNNGNVNVVSSSHSHGSSTNTNCHYEDAIGHFNKTFSQRGRHNTIPWEWVSDEEGCPITDYLRPLTLSDESATSTSHQPITILFIGSSIDEYGAADMCDTLVKQKSFHRINPYANHDEMINTAKLGYKVATLCTDGKTTIAYFKIFGMDRSCMLGSAMVHDNRVHNTTAQRIEQYMPHDVLRHLPEGPVVTVMGSCLWDLSEGCNNQPTMDPVFLKNYGEGMVRNYKVLQKLGIAHYTFWRTCHPVTASLESQGRTRPNQYSLRQHMTEVVEKEQLGIVIDWWKMILDHAPEEHIDMRDGRHYAEGATYALINMFLNSAFDHFPELLIGPFRPWLPLVKNDGDQSFGVEPAWWKGGRWKPPLIALKNT